MQGVEFGPRRAISGRARGSGSPGSTRHEEEKVGSDQSVNQLCIDKVATLRSDYEMARRRIRVSDSSSALLTEYQEDVHRNFRFRRLSRVRDELSMEPTLARPRLREWVYRGSTRTREIHAGQ